MVHLLSPLMSRGGLDYCEVNLWQPVVVRLQDGGASGKLLDIGTLLTPLGASETACRSANDVVIRIVAGKRHAGSP